MWRWSWTLLLVVACQAPRTLVMPSLASARVAPDYETYEIRRVGLLPFQGEALGAERAADLQEALRTEISLSTPYEIVLLQEEDLDQVERIDPHRRGWYRPRTLIEISERFQLDAIFFGTVTGERYYPPQLLSLQVDLVSAETGLVLWSSSVSLDANDNRVVDGLKIYYGSEDEDLWRVALLSPERFGRFAAYQVACLL